MDPPDFFFIFFKNKPQQPTCPTGRLSEIAGAIRGTHYRKSRGTFRTGFVDGEPNGGAVRRGRSGQIDSGDR